MLGEVNKMSSGIIRKIELLNRDFDYTLRESSRAKSLRLAVYRNGDLVVVKPKRINEKIVENFLQSQASWIVKKINYFLSQPASLSPTLPLLTRRDYLNQREKVRGLVKDRLEYFNNFYKLSYNKVNIRDQKTRWGSCSRRGCLNFNFRLIYLEPAVRDYIIVHELCHLKEFNHSLRFWKLVAQQIPNFLELRKKLRSSQLI